MQSRESKLTVVLLLAILIIGIQVALGFAIYHIFGSWEIRGTFGDMFGAVNALFSGLALAGVIYAILLQRAELSLQRQELELTREELKRSASAQEESARLIAVQLELATKQLRLTEDRDLAETRPIFRTLKATKEPFGRATCDVENIGATVCNLSATPPEGVRVTIDPHELFPSGEHGRIEVLYPEGTTTDVLFQLYFTDGRGRRRAIPLVFNKSHYRIEEPSPTPEAAA